MHTVNVKYKLELEDDSIELDMEFLVEVEKDPYGTHDSPSQIKATLISCNADDGKAYDFTSLHKWDVGNIQQRLINKFNSN